MDLSGIIFVVLAVGWAGYLIPKALKHHDDLAMSRPVDTFSESVRVVNRAAAPAPSAPPAEPAAVAPVAPVVHTVTRESARRAARRRRRVLAVLLLALLAISVTSYLAYTPLWSPAVPAALVVAYLVIARRTVRAQQRRRAVPVETSELAPTEAVEPHVPSQAAAPAEVEPDLGREDTQGLSRDELADAVAAPVLDEAGLWDPLPVTLPTYVNKARARRTVRTIEITGMTSSGHDAADSELARTAEEAAKADATEESEVDAEQRKVAGA